MINYSSNYEANIINAFIFGCECFTFKMMSTLIIIDNLQMVEYCAFQFLRITIKMLILYFILKK